MDYWEECIAGAFEEAGISATKEQIEMVVSWVDGAHENYGMAFGHDCIPSPIALENKELKKELKKERDKISCDECKGVGYTVSYGGTFQSTSQCTKCRGEGKVSP